MVKRDYYFNEALAVTLDYLQLLKGAALNNVAAGGHAAVQQVAAADRQFGSNFSPGTSRGFFCAWVGTLPYAIKAARFTP